MTRLQDYGRTVILHGCLPVSGPALLDYAKYDPDWKVWSLNYRKTPLPHVDLWFQLHGLDHMTAAHGGRSYLEWLGGLGCPVVMFERQIHRWADRIPNGAPPLPEVEPYPVAQAIQLAGFPYHTGSFPWMIDLAILRGFQTIVLIGVDFDQEGLWKSRLQAAEWLEGDVQLTRMSGRPAPNVTRVINDLRGERSGDESWAVPCIEYHLGIARGRGIQIVVEPESGLTYDKWGGLYGLEAGGHK